MVEINRKAFQIFQFLWPLIFFVFLSYQRGASWSSRRKPGLDWQQFIRWEKQLNAFQKLFTCAEFAPMMDRNYSICCYSTYHSEIFPGPAGLDTRGIPHLFVISPSLGYHFNGFHVQYRHLIIRQISFYLMCRHKLDVNLYSTELWTLFPLCAPVKRVQLLFLIIFDVLYKVGRLISMNVLFFIV